MTNLAAEADSRCVWIDRSGDGRNIFVVFRREFALEKIPAQAMLHLFADSRYRLFVNGTIVHYGPARFVTEFPEYDSIALGSYLKTGANCIVVEVNAFGSSTFETMPQSKGGFKVFGSVGSIDLATPGDWKAKKSDAWDPLAPSFSFAQGPIEIADLSKYDARWLSPEFDSAGWQSPVYIENHPWKQFSKRTIPLLSMEMSKPLKRVTAASVQKTELRLGVRIIDPRCKEYKLAGDPLYFCYYTMLYSPTEQSCELGMFWGPHYLNGTELKGTVDPNSGNRQNFVARLNQGWNLLYGEIEQLSESWGYLLGIPLDSGVMPYVNPDSQGQSGLAYCNPIARSELEKMRKSIPATMQDIGAMAVTWIPINAQEPDFPSRLVGWDHPKQVLDSADFDLSSADSFVALYDYETEFLGHVVVEFEAPDGVIFDISCDEKLRGDSLLQIHRHVMVNNTDRFISGGGARRFESFRVRGGRYIQLNIRNGSAVGGRVVIRSVTVRSASIPLDIQGSFCCSDMLFNWIWERGIDTVKACIEDAYLDCPWRERGSYIGDIYVEQKAHRALCSDISVARRTLNLFAQAQFDDGQFDPCAPSWLKAPLNDFSLIWIMSVERYVGLSGDNDVIAQLWPAIERVLHSPLWKSDENGLWSGNNITIFGDWGIPKEARKGDANAVINAYRYQSLLAASSMALKLGNHARSSELKSQAAKLKQAYNAILWDDQRGCFATGLVDGQRSDVQALHANILTLTFDLVSDENKPRVIRYVQENMVNNETKYAGKGNFSGQVELYFLNYLFDALYRNNLSSLAENYIRTNYKNLFDKNAWTIWEHSDGEAKKHLSYCHAWSCAPMYVFMERMAGITMNKTDEVLIAPEASSLSWVKASFPIENGTIDVSWRRDGNDLIVNVAAPSSMKVTIAPRGDLAKLRCVKAVQSVQVPELVSGS